MIEVDDVHFRYAEGGFALHVPELRIADGERVAIIGPSGAGKTTLLHLVAGIVAPDRGRIRVADVDVAALDDGARRRNRVTRMGLVFQEFALLEHLHALDNVLLPYRIGADLSLDSAARDRGRSLLADVGLAAEATRIVTRLSQGERQRVAVCRALVTEPGLLLADEPTGNLDPENKHHVLDLLLEQTERLGATFLAVTHDHDLLARFDRVIDFRALSDSGGDGAAHEGAAP